MSPEEYRARFRKVCEYIDAHLGEELTVERLSRVASFSKYHFHRQFSALLGRGVYEYVQLMRLHSASQQLAFRYWRSVLDVASSSGYESPEAFARVFKRSLGQTPSAFQQQPDWTAWSALLAPVLALRRHIMDRQFSAEDVKIVQFPHTRVAVLEHHGDPRGVSDTVRRFIAWRRETGLGPKVSATFNIFYDNPNDTPADEFHMDLCAATPKDIAPNAQGIVMKTIPAGRCAVIRHIGPDPLEDAMHYLYATWLPHSGESLRDFPVFCQRFISGADVPEHEAIVDIYLPLV